MANETTRAQAQLVIGLLIVAVGALFLLDNLGFLGLRHVLSFWPVALIVGGAALMIGGDERGGHSGGMILVAIGIALLVQRLGFVTVGWNIVWPLLLILGGARLLFRGLGRKQPRVALDKDGAGATGVIDVTAILGGVERRISTPDFRGGDITALLGGCELDLRESSIVGEATIDVFAVCGGITIKVPTDWTVVLNGIPIMGGFSQKTATPPDGSKRLVITGHAIMGGIEVRN